MKRGIMAALAIAVSCFSYLPAAWTSGQGDGMALPKAFADAIVELEVAIDHADLAQISDSVLVAKHHLQHVVNCLEGTNGKDYKNPVSGANAFCNTNLGQRPAKAAGVISGLRAGAGFEISSAAAQKNVLAALGAALGGLAKSDLNQIQATAASVLRYLKAARAAIG